MPLTPIEEHLEVDLSLPVLTTKVSRNQDSNIQPSACEANALTDCAFATAASVSGILMIFSPILYTIMNEVDNETVGDFKPSFA